MTSKSPNLKGWNPDSPSAAVIRVEENSVEWTYVALDLLKFTVTLGLTVYLSSKAFGLIGNMLGVMNQENSQQLETKKSLAKRLKRPDILNMSFNSYESRLLADVLGGEEISVSFADVGGLEAEVEEVFDSIVFPIQLWNHRQSLTTASKHSAGKIKDQNADLDRLVACPTGVLLYGAPGTGKTLIAKAIAKESGATFINIKASSVMDKWFGESDRLVSALFSLARKLGPSIVFIDEVETLLRKRDGSHTNPALATLQGVFLAEWDGVIGDRQESSQKELSSSPPPPPPSSSETVVVKKNAPVVVLGATNRPGDIDAAFLRRMPVQIRTQMPNHVQRLSILQAMLREESLDVAVSLQKIAENTEGYSGSDLREVVRIASAQRVKSMKQSFRDHFLRTPTSSTKQSNADAALNVILDQHQTTVQRPLLKEDFDFALDKTRDSVLKTMQFNTETFQKDNERKASHFLSLLASLSSQTNTK